MFPQIFGKYVLERELAAGGMARVFLATLRGAVGFEKRLVVKQIRAELASDEAFVRRFVEEAKTAVELNHPNIVPVYELGVEQGVYYIAMERCEGVALSELLAETGPLSAEEGAYVGIEICRALDYAHRRAGIVHRDVTPRNVMIDSEGAVRLIDFGIAAPVADGSDEAAEVEVFGSPGHMPPEQLAGGALTPATDVFALAVLLIEAWTGVAPFRRASAGECRKALLEPPPLVDQQVPELEPIAELIASAVALDPSRRPASPEQLARPLRRFVRSVDLGDVARRLGARVRRTERSPAGIEPPEIAPERPPSAPSETRTFAIRPDLAEWTSPATRKLESAPEPARRAGRARRPLQALLAIGGVLAAAAVGARFIERAPAGAVEGPRSANPAPRLAPPASAGSTPPAPSTAPEAVPMPRPRRAPAVAAVASASAAGACRLTLTSVPPGASARVAGRAYGSTPIALLELPCGTQAVSMHHPAIADTASFAVKLTPGAPRTVLVDWSSGEKSKVSTW
jgi:eukaryotic-like serine/threonine-protein kinase